MIETDPFITFLWVTPNPLIAIEQAGRTCYKSELKMTQDSATRFVRMLIERGHEAMLEHASLSYRVVCDRGISHEIVRHRLFSYAQESTRYCNYADTFNITVIRPAGLTPKQALLWESTISICEDAYLRLVDRNEWGDDVCKPEIARSVLPTCLKTAIVITGNVREWRHFFKLRCEKHAHPQMQEVAHLLLRDAVFRIPVVFDDLFPCTSA
jgi:thymidylate synthase (FAD)